jgi:DNA-binding transcriptional LysR family regulator
VRAQALFPDRFIGVVRKGHQLSKGRVTPARFAAGKHVLVSRRDVERGPVDDALEVSGLKRDIVASVGGFAAALALVRATDLIATVPQRHTENLRTGLHSFRLPVTVPEVTVSLLWHPRIDADPAHRWLRACVREVCGASSR